MYIKFHKIMIITKKNKEPYGVPCDLNSISYHGTSILSCYMNNRVTQSTSEDYVLFNKVPSRGRWGTFLHKEDYSRPVYLHLTAGLSLQNALSMLTRMPR